MYLNHYALTEKPFSISPDPNFLWLGEKHAEALATLNYGILDNKGFLLLTGEIGAGKTVLINSLVKQIDSEVRLSTISDPQLKLIDFYNILANELNMDRRYESKGDFLIHFKKFLIAQYNQGIKVLLIVDEAQRLTHDLMDEIRVLSNIELDHRKLINIFFVGQREFKEMLLEDRNRPLRQRITYNYHLDPLSQHETASYIKHRLKVAGAAKQIFSANAMREIFYFSKGVPRLINIICDDGLVTGYSAGTTMIDEDIIKECAKELQISAEKIPLSSEQPPAIKHDPLVEHRNTIKYIQRLQIAEKSLFLKETIKYIQRLKIAEKFLSLKDTVKNLQRLIPSAQLSNLKTAGLIALIIIFFAIAVALFRSPQSKPPANLVKPGIDSLRSEDAGENAKTLSLENGNSKAVSGDTQTPKFVNIETPDVIVTEKMEVLEEPADIKIEKFMTKTEPIGEIAAVDLSAKENTEGGSIIVGDLKEPPIQKIAKDVTPPINEQPFLMSEQKFFIFFKSDSTELDNKAFEEIKKIAVLVSRFHDSKIFIEGYSDSYGNSNFNQKLSRFRAEIVKSFLTANGIDSSSITAVGLGSKSPMGDNKTGDGRKKNRRVEIKVKYKSNGDRANYSAPAYHNSDFGS